jgi:hypothetical protein
MSHTKKSRFLGFKYYRSMQIEQLNFCGLVIFLRAGQCRSLFGFNRVVE